MTEVRQGIAARVRELRRARRWTQQELADRLGLSQSRLSQIERGEGSFTAEQFLTLLRLFNVGVEEFVPQGASQDRGLELQNALARLGAEHLRESENVLPRSELSDVQEVIRQTLIGGEPRLVTALGPVVLEQIDRIQLQNLDATLAKTGHDRRLAWAVENILDALQNIGRLDASQRRQRKLRRAEFALRSYLRFVTEREAERPNRGEDLLDREVRSERGLQAVRGESSPISRRWGIVSSIQPSDFADAIRSARAAD